MTRPRLLALGAVLASAVAIGVGLQSEAQPAPAPAPRVAETVPAAKLRTAVTQREGQRARADRLARILRHEERYEDTLTLAALVYPRANVALADEIMRCESGAGRGTPRPWAKNPTSSAGGRAQYLDTTWAATPEGRAGLSRFDPVAGVFAIMRHLHNSGNDASPWLASRGCWG